VLLLHVKRFKNKDGISEKVTGGGVRRFHVMLTSLTKLPLVPSCPPR
jgi:hypothetical protein